MEDEPIKAHAEIDAMTAEKWADSRKRLLLYAASRCSRFKGKLGWEPDDLINEALALVLSGKRRWPPVDADTGEEKDVSLVAFLCETMKGLSSNKYKKEKNILSLEQTGHSPSSESNRGAICGAHLNVASDEIRPDDNAIRNEILVRIQEVINRDQIITEIVGLWVEMPDLKPKDIAVMLNLPIKTVRNGQRRLKRMMEKLKGRQHKEYGPKRPS